MTNTPDTAGESRKPKVTININGEEFELHPGRYPVQRIKNLPKPKIPKEDDLCLVVDCGFDPLGDKEHIEIKGGEVFASNCPTGGAA